MNSKSFDEITARLKEIHFEEHFDMIVAIANGGLVPAALINQLLNVDVQVLRINFKDEKQNPRYDSPQLLQQINFNFKEKKILLVDDRIKSGATIVLAKELLKEAALIKTFAVNGNADYALYNENCFRFPWTL
ncbi:MAG: phosphoribosyltransferase [Paludibacteraceae bacterium]|nr:phosphoribosyltransferase [Paludibacteraceae bacterium]